MATTSKTTAPFPQNPAYGLKVPRQSAYSHAQKAVPRDVKETRERAGVNLIRATLKQLLSLKAMYGRLYDSNPRAGTNMLVKSLDLKITGAIEDIEEDCEKRGYPEVKLLHPEIEVEIRQTHAKRSANAKMASTNKRIKTENGGDVGDVAQKSQKKMKMIPANSNFFERDDPNL